MSANPASPAPVFAGHLDHVSPTQAVGWATCDGAPSTVLVCKMRSFYFEHFYRPDLVDVGIDPEAGFRITFYEPLPRREPIRVRHYRYDVQADGPDLIGSPFILADTPPAAPPVDPPRDGPIIFMHIPKTAGTSIRRAIDRVLPARVALSGDRLGDPVFLDRFAASRPPLAIGHVSYGVHHMLRIPPRYVTVLRDPIARVVSFLRYARALEHPLHAGFCRLTFREIVEGGYTEQTNNHACRMIAGISVDQGRVITDRWLLDLAWHNLRRHFDLVGTTEDIGGFQTKLGGLLGVELGAPCVENRGGGGEWDAEVRAALPAIVAMNGLDIELWRRVTIAAADALHENAL